MADENPEVDPQAMPTEPHGSDTKPETDWKAEARKWEARAKENKGAADELQKLKESQMAEAENIKAVAERAKAEAEAAKAEAERLRAEKERTEAVKAIACERGIDADLLDLMAGDTPERIAENAAVLKAKIAAMPIYPNAPDNGAGTSPAVSKEQIMQIKDPVERVKQIAAHPEQFK